MLVPSTPGGVVHNSSERPTPASQCVLTALARRARCLPARRNADELAARTRGRHLWGHTQEARRRTTAGMRRDPRRPDQGPPGRAAVSDTSRAAAQRRRSFSPFANAKRPARVTTGRSGPARAKLLPLLWTMVDRDSCQAKGVPSKGPPLPLDAVPRSPAHTKLRARRIGQPPFQPIRRGDRKCV